MSVTQNWSTAMVMSPYLYNQMRNMIFSKIVPSTISNIEFGGVTISSLSFKTVQTTITVSTSGPTQGLLLINAPFQGSLIDTNDNTQQFKGSVAINVDLNGVTMKPGPNSSTYLAESGTSWENYLYLTENALSIPVVTLTQGSAATLSTLQSFFQTEVENYVESCPHSLGVRTAENLPAYFTPNYQAFTSLANGSNPNDPRVLQLAMVKGDDVPVPIIDNGALDSESLLNLPTGSNGAFAANDFTLLNYMADHLESQGKFTSISVTQNPAVLTAKYEKKGTNTITIQIDDNAFQISIRRSAAFNIEINYALSISVETNADGTQALVFENDLTKCNISVNTTSPIVISAMAIGAMLQLASPLHGMIWMSVMATIQYYVTSMVTKLANKGQFTKQSKDTNGNIKIESLALDGGMVIYLNVPDINTGTSQFLMPAIVEKSTTQGQNLEASFRKLLDNMDALDAQPVKKANEADLQHSH